MLRRRPAGMAVNELPGARRDRLPEGGNRLSKRSEQFFAVAAPGLEDVCGRELIALGCSGVRVLPGGVEFSGGLREIYSANLWLRTASRILVRLDALHCRDFPTLYRKALRLPWGRFVKPATRLRVRASSRGSRLSHTGRIAATLQEAVDRALGRAVPPEDGPEQLLLARFEDDWCHLSVDSSGDLLHRRAYREDIGPAPLRETLAAGILLLLGWEGATPLVDPMCGSGTFPIEAALLAYRRPPGARRVFSFMNWPRYRPGLWQALLAEAARGETHSGPTILGSDREARVVAAAGRNADRAGVAGMVAFRQQDIACQGAVEGPGLVLCNPPYGARLGRSDDLGALYRLVGQVYRSSFAGWRGALLCPDPHLAAATGLPLRKVAELSSGGIKVALMAAEL
jgi:putative N6-adenine-specific DNA methylase